MKKNKVNKVLKKSGKILLSAIIGLIVLLLLLSIALSTPFVQTKMAHYATEILNKEFGVNINIDEATFTFFGSVKLKKVLILDHHKDTLMYSGRIKTSILDLKELMDGRLVFGDLRLNDFYFQIKTYKKETDTNLDKFVDAFDDGKPGSGKFLMTSKNVYIDRSRFVLVDENKKPSKDVDFSNINADLQNFKIQGPNVSANISKMSFKDFRGAQVENLKSHFVYTKRNIILKNLEIETKQSYLKGYARLNYVKEKHDFSDFNNKVVFNVKLDSASVSSNDIRYFYDELGKNQTFQLKTKIKGTLNDFYVTHLQLVDNRNSIIKGDVNFKNLFPKSPGEFFMKGKFTKISSNYTNLTQLLPNILGKKLPSSLSRLGQFDFSGTAEVTQEYVDTDFVMNTALGTIESDIKMSELGNIDNAKYKGNIILDNFDIGSFINDKQIGKVSFNFDVDGKGFTKQFISTTIVGDINRLNFNNYDYTKVIVDGSFKFPLFKGKFYINDPNLRMDFDGTVDLAEKENNYDFHSVVDYANLHNLKFVQDTISVFRGDIVIKAQGNTFDNLKGNFSLTNSSYQNTKDLYFIDYLNVDSSFDESGERAINISSSDIIEGSIIGKYKFNELQKIAENSLGSLYANYRPNKVLPNQYLKFDISLNSKIVEIFDPNVSIAKSTRFKGNLSSEAKDFKLDFVSPKITAYDVTLDNFSLKLDNKNPLYNSYVQSDSIKTKYYKIRDFSLINVFVKDSLQFRTEFKGGNAGQDYYNFNFYHTINKENKNVVGFKKSELFFKNYLWKLNEKDDNEDNKIEFDKQLTDFSFENISLTHEDESINFFGTISGKRKKDLKLAFENVDLNKITPDIDKFRFEGSLNGTVNFKQDNDVFLPIASLNIDKLCLNDIFLGELNLDVKGDESLRKFSLNSTIDNDNVESLNAGGTLEVSDDKTYLDVDLNLDHFNLGVLDRIGGDVITNIRGFATGNTRIEGDINQLDYNGRLFVNKAGMTVPYLNGDYVFDENSVVDVTENKFIIRETGISDTKFNTKGTINGFIKHKQFGDWQLDLSVNSNRIMVLNTVDHEDAAYFGTAFIKGTASITGPTDGLFIKVEAESAKGTDIKIPINDAEAIEENNYIHFLTAREKDKKGLEPIKRNYQGLEMEFNFEINENADIEVILNRESGHGMKGKGVGTLLFRINTLGKFEMWGDFIVRQGIYNFKYGSIANKKFEVKKGGTITWSGNPMAADLNLSAIYRTTANPAVLLDNPSINKKTEADVIIDIRGNLQNPDPDFNIDFPNVSSTIKSEIQYKLSDKDTRQKQAFSLLAFGGFMTDQGASQSFSNNVAIEKASSIFNDIFHDDADKLHLGLDYVSPTKTPGYESDGRVGVSVSSKINDRFTINGKVGVPVGGINENTIVGDFTLQYRVNEDGSMNLRVFNKENDLSYLGQGIGYKQGVGMSYQVDFNHFRELVNKLFKNPKINKIKPVANPNDQMNDSDFPENIQFNKDKEHEKPKKQPDTNNNKEAIPDDE